MERPLISPRKKSPRNAKNKRRRGECPVILGNEYEVDIREMSPTGEGIARVNGFMICVRNVKLGDHVKVKITYLDSVSADAEITTQA